MDLLSWKVISHLLSGFGVLTLESLAIGVILGFLLSFMVSKKLLNNAERRPLGSF